MFRQIASRGCEDVKSLNLLLNFVGNFFEDTNYEFAAKIAKETCIIKGLQSILSEHKERLGHEVLEFVIWI